MDIFIEKPLKVRGYDLHRLVEQHQQGVKALWVDEGRHVRIRPRNAEVPQMPFEKILGFTVKACVAYSSGNKHKYLPTSDWRGRRRWLEERSKKCGFEIIGVHVSGGMQVIDKQDGTRFTVDSTEFTGLLKITNLDAFQHCYLNGISKVGKAFGLNMIIIE
ncbi:MAG: hypothetical protein RL078_1785 [Bacteroidota bacterium]